VTADQAGEPQPNFTRWGVFLGLRLRLVCTLHGLPVMFSLDGAKGDERENLLGMLENDIGPVNARPGQILMGDKILKPFRKGIESVNRSLKGQLSLEEHGGKPPGGVLCRVLVRLLALTAGIWHNDKTGKECMRSLIACEY
jgi:hypothetical protein